MKETEDLLLQAYAEVKVPTKSRDDPNSKPNVEAKVEVKGEAGSDNRDITFKAQEEAKADTSIIETLE